jgi:hypothetical protein
LIGYLMEAMKSRAPKHTVTPEVQA